MKKAILLSAILSCLFFSNAGFGAVGSSSAVPGGAPSTPGAFSPADRSQGISAQQGGLNAQNSVPSNVFDTQSSDSQYLRRHHDINVNTPGSTFENNRLDTQSQMNSELGR